MYGEGIEVGADELTMTDAEAHDVLAWKASPTDEARLLEVARGWPAVLGLAAMTATPDLPQDELLPKALYDYLATELLAAASAEVQEGLLLLAAASVGNVEVARLVLGDGSDAILDDAVRRGLALRVDDQSFSLHPLLQELLVARLKDRREDFAMLLERLFVLIHHRRWDEALAVAEVLPDARFVSEVLSNGLDELLRAGRRATVQRWVEIGKLYTPTAESSTTQTEKCVSATRNSEGHSSWARKLLCVSKETAPPERTSSHPSGKPRGSTGCRSQPLRGCPRASPET